MLSYYDEYSVMKEVHKLLKKRYEGVEGEAYEVLMYQVAPKTYDKVILLVEIEVEESFAYLQIIYVDLKKNTEAVTIIGEHGLPADYAEYGRHLAKAIFSAIVGRLCAGWK